MDGISLSEYIQRRRMSQAAFELQRTVPGFWKEALEKNSFQIYACWTN